MELTKPGIYDFTGKTLKGDTGKPVIAIQGKGITIKGGTFIGDRKDFKAPYGNGTHVIQVKRGSMDITIDGVKVTNASGDGIYVGGCERLVIKNSFATGNRRQGLSIISGRGIVVENCTFEQTSGTDPADGIDIEPDKDDVVDGVKIRRCVFRANDGAHIELAPKRGRIANVRVLECIYDGKSVPIKGIPVSAWAKLRGYLGDYSGYPKTL